MFADVTPDETNGGPLSWLASSWASTGIALLALAVLAGLAVMVARRYGLPRLDLAGHMHGLLVKRGRSDGLPPTPQEATAPVQHQAGPEVEDAATGAAPPQPAPQQDAAHPAAPEDPDEEVPAWLLKALVVIASIPTLLALPWAAYAVAQLLPVPLAVALPLGVLFDAAMVGSVLVGLLVPSVSRQASALGWVAAGAAAAAIGVHTGISGALVFAAAPLISKALWGLLITIRRQRAQRRAAHAAAEQQRKEKEAAARAAQEERDAELSTDLTFEQQREIAQKRRDAQHKKDLAAAELELELAESEADHQKALAEIRRLGEQQREEDKETAGVYEQRLRLERQLSTLKGDAPAFLTRGAPAEESEVVGEITATAGFGSAAPQAFGFQRPLDVKALTPEGAKTKFEDLPEHYQALVKYAHTAKEPTMREAGRKLNKDGRTIGRWVERLEDLGFEFPFDRKK